eukprot:4973716-Prorocentrum_lima.AAC.1
MENDPQAYVAGAIHATMQRYRAWYLGKWDHTSAWGTPQQDFDQYIADTPDRVSQGGLLELSAACSAFRLQALVYDHMHHRTFL